MKLWLLVALSMCLSVAMAPAAAVADSSVVVLGLRSLDGDDAQALELSRALRDAAQGVAGYKVSDRDVSLAQMSLAHGCDEPDTRCMADIASTLRVDRLIYGTIAHAGNDVQVSLFNFDAVTGKLDGRIDHKLAASKLEPQAVATTARQLMDRLTGKPPMGSLRVIGDTPGAEVSVDGDPSGVLDEHGELLISPVSIGKHIVTVSDPQRDRRKNMPVMVGENATATLRIALIPLPPVSQSEYEMPAPEPSESASIVRPVVGWTSVALAVGLAGATVYSWVRLKKIADDPALNAYRAEFPAPGEPGGSSDVCREASRGELVINRGMGDKAGLEANARDLCQESDTLEVLQYVFLGSAIALGGLGTYLLLTKPKHTKQGALSLRPSWSHGRAMLRATMRF